MSWFWRRPNFGGRSSSTTAPSTRARTNPALRAASNSSRNSPFRPRTSGASTSSFVPAGQPRMMSVIWLALVRWIGEPSFGQCGVPARA